MSTASLASTETRLFRAYWQDGLVDLLAGVGVTAIGVGWLAGFWLAGVVVPPVLLVMWPVLRQRITQPRLGQVRFGAKRRIHMRYGLIAVASLGVLLLGQVIFGMKGASSSAILRWLAPGIPALLLALLALSAAEALRLVRFVAYAGALVVAALGVAALDADPGWALLAGGLVVVASGAWRLRSFVRRFPRLPAEMDA